MSILLLHAVRNPKGLITLGPSELWRSKNEGVLRSAIPIAFITSRSMTTLFVAPRTALPGADQLKSHFDMHPLPDGGHFAATYQAIAQVKNENEIAAATTGIYLLEKGQVMQVHRFPADKVLHYYGGGPLVVFTFEEATKSHMVRMLGADVLHSELLQYVIPANTWFGAYIDNEEAEYSLVGMTIVPGYGEDRIEMARREYLLENYPQAMDAINRLTVNVTNLKDLLHKKP